MKKDSVVDTYIMPRKNKLGHSISDGVGASRGKNVMLEGKNVNSVKFGPMSSTMFKVHSRPIAALQPNKKKQ